MLLAILVIFASVGAGAALAALPGVHGRAIGVVRTFALVAALGVVGVHLLPHAIDGIGLGVLFPLIAGLLLPPLLQRLVTLAYLRARRGSVPCVGLEIGYVGLLVHRIGDGVVLGLAAERGLGMLVAIAAHTTPVAAVVVLAFTAERGRRTAFERAAGLVLSSLVGLIAVAVAPPDWFVSSGPWIDAAVAGLLLHVVAHGLTHDLPVTHLGRVGDLLAGGLGIAVVLIPGVVGEHHGHGHGHHHVVQACAHGEGGDWVGSSVELAGSLAPGLVVGLLLAAAMVFWRARSGAGERGHFRGIGHGLLAALLDPAAGHRMAAGRRSGLASPSGAVWSPSFATAYWVAAPALGVETLVLTLAVFGPAFAVTRLLLAILVASVVAASVSVLAGSRSASVRLADPEAAPPPSAAGSGGGGAVEGMLARLGPWVVAGHLVAAYADSVSAGGGTIGSWTGWGATAVVVLLASAVVVHPLALVPVGLVAAERGVGAEQLLLALVLAPIPWRALLGYLLRVHGAATAAGGLAAGWVTAVVGAHAVASWVVPGGMDPARGGPSALGVGWILFGGLLLAVGVWRNGVRGWISALVPPHEHAHGSSEEHRGGGVSAVPAHRHGCA